MCVCVGDAAAVSVSDLEFVSMFPSARGECFNGDVATLECSQVENGERRLERLRLRVLSATIRIRIRIKRGRLPVSPAAAAAAMEHQSSPSVDSALRCFCFDFVANEITYSIHSLSLPFLSL